MNIWTILGIVLALIAAGGLTALYFLVQETARKIDALESQYQDLSQLEKTVAGQNKLIATQGNSIKRLQVDVEARDGIIEEQGKAIETLKARIRRLDAKWDALITWVRTKVPEPDLDEFLAQLEAGPTGG